MPETALYGGTGIVFRTTMSYDTGADIIIISLDEFPLPIPEENHASIPSIDLETADNALQQVPDSLDLRHG